MAQASHTVHARGLPPVRLRRVLEHIETHLGEDVAQRRLAGIAQLSMDHFARLFRQSTGLPPHRYVLERRITRARYLVVERRLSLAEIAYALGFPSQSHFTTMFHRLVGMTPGSYRAMTGDIGCEPCRKPCQHHMAAEKRKTARGAPSHNRVYRERQSTGRAAAAYASRPSSALIGAKATE